MTVKLLAEQHLEFLSLKEASHARLSLHLSKCHIVEIKCRGSNAVSPNALLFLHKLSKPSMYMELLRELHVQVDSIEKTCIGKLPECLFLHLRLLDCLVHEK